MTENMEHFNLSRDEIISLLRKYGINPTPQRIQSRLVRIEGPTPLSSRGSAGPGRQARA